MARPSLALALGLLLSGWPGATRADDAFSSDRPGYANGVTAAPVGLPITETGVTFRWDEDDAESLSIPDLRIRMGIVRWLEARIDAPTFIATFDDPTAFGAGPLTLALKLAGPVRDKLGLSLIPSVTLPFGTDAGPVTTRLELNWSAAIGIVGLAGNLALGSAAAAMGREVLGEASLWLSVQAHPSLGVFVQTFATWLAGDEIQPFLGAGIYAQVHSRVQVDFWADVGLRDTSTRLATGLGTTVWWGPRPETPPTPPQAP